MFYKILRNLALVLAVALVISGCSLTKKDPTEVLSLMQQHLAQLTSIHYDANLNVRGLLPVAVPTAEPVEQAMTMKVAGNSSFENPLEPLSESTMTLVLDSAQGNQTVIINNKRINNEQFVNFVDDPNNPLPGAEQFANVWFSVPESGEMDMTDENSDTLSNNQVEQIRNAFADAELITLVEDLGTEKINGTKAYHYQIMINEQAALNFLEQINQITGQTMALQEQQNFEQMIRQLSSGTMDVWISAKDQQLLQITFDQIKFADTTTQTQTTVSGTVVLSEHNQPITIERPENPQPLLNMLAPTTGDVNMENAQIPTEEELNELLGQFDEFEQLSEEEQQAQINQLLNQMQAQEAGN